MWLPIALISYFFTATANLADKFLLTKYLKEPIVYAFTIATLNIVAVVLIPFGVVLPENFLLFAAFLSGLTFIAGLYTMFYGLTGGETTQVATVVGGSQPLFVFLLAAMFLGERLSGLQILAALFLVVGLFLIGYQPHIKVAKKIILISILSGLFFAISYVLSKYLFENMNFVSGFFWARIGGVLAAVLCLIKPRWRKVIFTKQNEEGGRKKTFGLILVAQIIGAAGFMLTNVAIALGSVTLVNAMQGVQYAILFIMSLVAGRYFKEVKEDTSTSVLLRKTLAIIIIAIGLTILTKV